MPKIVVNGAVIRCNQGAVPVKLVVLPTQLTHADEQSIATVMDFVPMVNIGPFGMCRSMANPAVVAATSAAMGVLTPAPCVPNTVAPWSPGSNAVTVDNLRALTDDSTCMCAWAGSIDVVDAGSPNVTTDG
jgi:hypothetical protein